MTSNFPLYVIHENPEWFEPIAEAFEREGVSVREWQLTDEAAGEMDLFAAPPEGVFWSRLSASAHLRGNQHAKDFGRALLAWLERSGRRVVGGSSVLELEVSKVRQHLVLDQHGFDVPQTTAVFGGAGIKRAALTLEAPFILKHNQGGKGFSVRRFESHGELEYFVSSPDEFQEPVDGITLLQEYLQSAEPFVTRAEFVGGKFLYAVRVDTSAGSFELCPAVPSEDAESRSEEFTLREGFADHPIIERYEQFLAEVGIEIAGIEFIETVDGRLVTYDINTNTNYNPAVEARASRTGGRALVEFFSELLARQQSEQVEPTLVGA